MTIHGIDAPMGQSLRVEDGFDTTGTDPETRILVPRPPQTGRSAEVEGASIESRLCVPHPPNMGWGRGDGDLSTYAVGEGEAAQAAQQALLSAEAEGSAIEPLLCVPHPPNMGWGAGDAGLTTYAVGGAASTEPSGYSLLTAGGDPAKDVPGLPGAALDGLTAGGVPSLGASTLALLEQVSDDMRRANAEMRKEATRATVEEIRGQAQKMREQAVLNLALGLTSAAISAGVSLGSSIRSASLLSSMGGITADLNAGQSALLQAKNAVIDSQGKALHGAADAVDAVKNFLSASTDAAVKEADARIETLRAHRAALESLDESVKEVIKKALDAQQAVAESMNQTRTRILT